MERYDGPIIDTHHHIWRHKDIGWLQPPLPPRMFGDYFGLCRDYPVEEWKYDILPHKVVKSVHVTANWAGTKATRALDETRWLASVQAEHGYPHGIVVQADLTEPEVEAQLEAQRTFRGVCGVRHQLYWDSRPLMQYAPRPDLCNTPAFRKGFALLEKLALHFELQVFASQVQYAVELVKDFPKVRFILLHSGMLTDRSPEMIAHWRDALGRLAAHPNVHVKISGLSMFSFGWTKPQLRQVIRDTIQIFGAERTIYGSNFPVEKLHASYADFIGAYKEILAEYPPAAQRAIFHDNGEAFYRLSE